MATTPKMILRYAPIPDGFDGTLQEFNDLNESLAEITVPAGFLVGSTGSTPPPPDSGPWFKNGGIDGIYVWDPVSSAYVPMNQNVDIGKIEMFAYPFPDGGKWVICDGRAVPRTSPFDGLFAIIGTLWGTGDGSTTFNVPDMRGRVPIGVGTGTGLTVRQLGGRWGEETHILAPSEVPPLATTGFNSGNVSPETPVVGYGAGAAGAHNNIQPSLGITFAMRYA